MTQAFNLALLANNLNAAGRLDATDGLTGLVPLANGGTGASNTINSIVAGTNIAVSISGTQATITSTGGGVTSVNGQAGAVVTTDIGSIGVVMGAFYNANIVNGTNATFSVGTITSGAFLLYNNIQNAQFRGVGLPIIGGAQFIGQTATIATYGGSTLPGSWRCVSPALNVGVDNGDGTFVPQWYAGMWVRYA